MTYNVHGGVGVDGKLDLLRIADVIARQEPDIVALQELDVGRQRSERQHQAKLIAGQLGMFFQFHPVYLLKEGEEYGDAILSKMPMRLVKVGVLPTLVSKKFREPRGALWVEIEIKTKNKTISSGQGQQVEKLQILNTHFGLARAERKLQALELLGENWLEDQQCQPPAILCGDFNSLPGGRVYRLITKKLQDVQRILRPHQARATFPSKHPLLRLDYIFITKRLKVKHIIIPQDPLTKLASDHLPLVADLELARKDELLWS